MALLKTAIKAAGTAIKKTGQEAAGTGIETMIQKFGPQLTDQGKNAAKVIQSKTDLSTIGRLNQEQGQEFIGALNSGNTIAPMQVLDNARRNHLELDRQNKVIESTIPTVTYKKGGSLEAPRKAVQDFVEADPTRKDKLLSGEIKRGSIANIVDETGDIKDIQGMTKFLTSMNANYLTFPSRTKRNASKGVRLNLMKAPEPELRNFAAAEFPDNPELIEEYLKTYARGFSAVQEAARRNGISPRQLWEELTTGKLTPRHKKVMMQYDAGHWFSTRYNLDKITDPLDRAPTSGRSARIESRTENIKGGAKIEHETNPHLAEMVGIPRTWKEDFLLFADSKLNQKGLPQWEELLGSKAMKLVESLPHNASKAEAEVVFKQIMEIVNKQGESAKDFQRTARLENRPPSDNPDYYLYGKDQEIEVDEYAPIPGDPEFE